MRSDWATVTFGDVARIRHGYAFSGMSEDADATLPVVVGIGNFDYSGGFRFGSTTLKRYAGEYPREFALQPGDLLLAMTCQTPGGEILGIPGQVPDDGVTYLHNQRLGKVEIIDEGRLDAGFVFHLTRWSVFNRHLFVTASGSKILHTSPGRIEDFEFALPPVEEQRGIAATLGALDAKIESNRRAIAGGLALVDAYAHAVSENSGALVALADLVTVSRATVNPATLGDALVHHFSIPAFDDADGPEEIEASEIKSNKLLISRPTILISRLNPRFNRTWWCVPSEGLPALASTEFIALTADDDADLGAIWLAVRDAYFRSELTLRVTGTSGSHQRIRPDDLLAIDVPDVRMLPSAEKQRAYKLLELIHQRRREIRRLTAMRDVLLPELLSGRLRVPEEQSGVEAAA